MQMPATGAPQPSSKRLTLCGSLSLHPVSLGAAMHLAGYAELGLPFTYVPFGVTDVPRAVAGMRALGIRGLGVSMPYKQDVVALVDALDPMAARMGAVNTIVNDGGRLTGWNTDGVGAVRAIEELRPLAGARVLLLGAGGAARAVAHAFADAGARLVLANRDATKAERIAAEVGAALGGDAPRATDLDETRRAGDYDVVVNATSLGMSDVDPRSPIPEDALREGQVVMDIVYKPIETALVVAAERRGARAIHGGRMLLFQAARQFELYTGVERAPVEAMERSLFEEMAR